MKSSCIPHPSRDPLALIRYWQLVFTDGNQTDAALLSLFEYGHNFKLDEMEKKPLEEQCIEDLYQDYTEDELAERIMMVSKDPKTIRGSIDRLVALKVLSVHKNPNKRFKYDTTKHFLFNPAPITEWLKNNYEPMSDCDKSIKAFGRVSRSAKRQVKSQHKAKGHKYSKNGKCLDTNCRHCNAKSTVGKNPQCGKNDTTGKIPDSIDDTVGKNPQRVKMAENTPKTPHDREISLNESLVESYNTKHDNNIESERLADASEQSSHSGQSEQEKEQQKKTPSEAQKNHWNKIAAMAEGCGMNFKHKRSSGKILTAIKELNELYPDEATAENIGKACLAYRTKTKKTPQPAWVVDSWPELISNALKIDCEELTPFKKALKIICVPETLGGWDAEQSYLIRLANRIKETGGTVEQIKNFTGQYWGTFANTPPTLRQLAGQWVKYTQLNKVNVVRESKCPPGVTEQEWQRAKESQRRLEERKAKEKEQRLQRQLQHYDDKGERTGLTISQIISNITQDLGVAV